MDGVEITVTYETLFELLRLEKNRTELQKLSPTFFGDVSSYVADKQSILSGTELKSDLFASAEREKIRVQLDNIRRLIKDLYDRREQKILSTAVNKSKTGSDIIDTSSMLPEERMLFEDFVLFLDKSRQISLNPMLYGSLAEKNEKPAETLLVRFERPVPQFVGRELEVYGPFMEEDMATLPSDIANLLIRKGRAKAMD